MSLSWQWIIWRLFWLWHKPGHCLGTYIVQLSAIKEVNLANKGWKGVLPPELPRFTSVKFAVFSHNQFEGSIPESWSTLSALERLDVSDNLLEGQVPSFVASLENLTEFIGRENRFIGELPGNLQKLQWLRELDLADNQLEGQIPESLSKLSQLSSLDLSDNSLEGVLLDTWCHSLVELVVYDNSLIGQIPFEFGQLRKLSVYGNNLVGSIPNELGRLKQLERLRLQRNCLQGTFPKEIMQAMNLERISVGSNSLYGQIPAELCDLKFIEEFRIDTTGLHGELPVCLSSLESLKFMYFDETSFYGQIPEAYGRLFRLEDLRLDTSSLTGTIPSELGLLTKLETLYYHSNELSGQIPTEYTNMLRLDDFQVRINRLTGSIPEGVSKLTKLTYFYFHMNRLTGQIPASIGNLSRIQEIRLYNNSLTGEIPAGIAHFSNRADDVDNCMWFNDNFFSGQVPSALGRLSKTEAFFVMRNRLTGQIPETLGSMEELQNIWVMQNSFSGTLPSSLGRLRNLIGLGAHKNVLSGTIPSLWLSRALKNVMLHSNNFYGRIPFLLRVQTNGTLLLHSNRLACDISGFDHPADIRFIGIVGNRFYVSHAMPKCVQDWESNEMLLDGDLWKASNIWLVWIAVAVMTAFTILVVLTLRTAWTIVAVLRGLWETPSMIGSVYLREIPGAVASSSFGIALVFLFAWGANYYKCSTFFEYTSAAFFMSTPIAEGITVVLWSFHIGCTLVRLWARANEESTSTYDSFNELKAMGLLQSLGWFGWLILTLVLTIPCILYSISATIPDVHMPWNIDPKVVSGLAPVLTVASQHFVYDIAVKYGEVFRINRISLVLVSRTTTYWLGSVLSTILLHENCFAGWLTLWKPCHDETRPFDVLRQDGRVQHFILNQKAFCSLRSLRTVLRRRRCLRSVIATIAPLLIRKMVYDVFFSPACSLFIWLFEKVHLAKFCFSRHRREGGPWQAKHAIPLIVSLLEMGMIWVALIPLIAPLIVLSFLSHAFVCRIGVYHLGKRLDATDNHALPVRYLTIMWGFSFCFTLVFAAECDTFGWQYILLLVPCVILCGHLLNQQTNTRRTSWTEDTNVLSRYNSTAASICIELTAVKTEERAQSFLVTP